MNKLNCSYFLQDHINPNTHLVISLVLLLTLGYYVLKNRRGKLAKIGLIPLMVGGLHNLYHRVMYICVWDNINFFDLFLFNLADILVTIGIVLILFDLLTDGKKNTNN